MRISQFLCREQEEARICGRRLRDQTNRVVKLFGRRRRGGGERRKKMANFSASQTTNVDGGGGGKKERGVHVVCTSREEG